MPTEINRTAPAGLNFLVAALVGVALAMTRIQKFGFVFFVVGSGFFLAIGVLSLWLGAKETVKVDLVVKAFLALLIAAIAVQIRNDALLENPYAPLRTIQHTLTASLVLLGVLVAGGAIREWGGITSD